MTRIQEQRAAHYIRHIRNPRKRAYAEAYLRRLNGGPLPDSVGIGYLAAQAVRMALSAIVEAA